MRDFAYHNFRVVMTLTTMMSTTEMLTMTTLMTSTGMMTATMMTPAAFWSKGRPDARAGCHGRARRSHTGERPSRWRAKAEAARRRGGGFGDILMHIYGRLAAQWMGRTLGVAYVYAYVPRIRQWK